MAPARSSQSVLTMQAREFAKSPLPLPPEAVIFGQCEAMESVRQQIERILCTSVPVLITGESGSGKETIARYIYWRSCSGSAPFLKVRCSAITDGLAASAVPNGRFVNLTQRNGNPRPAGRGTFFLDDVADLDSSNQAELMQLLQDGQFCFVSRRSQEPVEMQLICASTRNLEEAIQEGRFRRDLLHLIDIGSVDLPPLRERVSDIPILVDFLIESYRKEFHLQVSPISQATMTMLKEYEWPGNIRQLESVVKRYVVLGTENAIKAEMSNCDELMSRPLNGSTRSNSDPLPEVMTHGERSLKRAVRDLESKIILRSLEENHWNRRRAAQALNISYRALLYKMKGAGLA
jgi:two-component system response regulator AtoC